MDVSKIKVTGTAAMHVKDAAGTPLYDHGKPVKIVFHGPSSRQFAELETRQTARSVKRHNEGDGKLTARPAEERRQEAVEDLTDLTVSFDGLTYGDLTGRDLFAAVYGDPELGFIIVQANRFINDWGNFSGGSATN